MTQLTRVSGFYAALVLAFLGAARAMAANSVASVALIEASNASSIETLTSGQTIYLSQMPSPNLSLSAIPASSTGSIKFVLDGTYTHVESEAPYSLCGDVTTSFTACPQLDVVGAHTLVVTPYTGTAASGTAGTALTLKFTIAQSPPAPTVTGLSLIDASNATAITGYDPIANAALVNLYGLPSQSLSIRANVGNVVPGSIGFELDGTYAHTENSAPFSLCGDDVTSYTACSQLNVPGTHTLTATPYSGTNLSGTAGTPYQITFNVGNYRYLSQLGAKCNGSDDSAIVSSAIAGATGNAYTLLVDCPATLNIGLNIDKSIFINNETTINFIGTGKFIVNNLFTPAFVIANSNTITLNNWNVQYVASYQTGTALTPNTGFPVSFTTGGYYQGGVWHVINPGSSTGYAIDQTTGKLVPLGLNGSGRFNDYILTNWLQKNKNMPFAYCESAGAKTGGLCAQWAGSINESAIFFITGDSHTVNFNNLTLQAADLTQVNNYIPFGFMFALGFKSNQTISQATPLFTSSNASTAFATPNEINFNGVTLDGYMMGFQGTVSNSTFTNINALHYSDCQDSSGNNVGGIDNNGGTTFPPPHFAYIDNYLGVIDPALFNTSNTFNNIKDAVGPNNTSLRMGKARQIGGYADEFKIQCNGCTIENVTSNRLDGLISIMEQTSGLPQAMSNLTLSNVAINYNSGFVNNNYETIQGGVNHWHMMRDACGAPAGGSCLPMTNVTFDKLVVTDVSVSTEVFPFDFAGDNIVFTANGKTALSSFTANQWTGSGTFQGIPSGSTSTSAIEFITKNPASSVTIYGP